MMIPEVLPGREVISLGWNWEIGSLSASNASSNSISPIDSTTLGLELGGGQFGYERESKTRSRGPRRK